MFFMDKQQKRDYLYMRMARTWAENSYCVRRKVGALLVKNQMIISDGYNGTPSGFEMRTTSPNPMCCMPKQMRSPK